MRTSRIMAAAAAAAIAFTSGCGGGDEPKTGATSGKPPASASASPAANAKDVLDKAVKDLNASTYTYRMAIPEGTFSGAIDPAGKQQVKAEGAVGGVKFTIEGIVLGTEYYYRTSAAAPGIDPKKWYKLDRSKVTKPEIIGLIEEKDPTGSQTFVGRVGSAKLESPTTITGTFDLSVGGDLGIDDAAVLAALGEKAKRAPFTATLDDQQRLTSVKITVPAYGTVGEQTMTVEYAGHGQPVAVAAPKSADVLAATAAVYALLNR
ncbi:hypothetical protein KZZ52_08135 [Dactylosporangium sp. AC04546]|uniref:hypothetical protein n=1 Tax=Dactylosporangium sp. AC04546 TaxID=2862460 RepID=UPI001EDFF26F|nr:hypothetical protein [Dactylosporangium sp. AC04546]WVK85348.1 hypothetical protein KZZ52_08135 [Dactylosporangium sp. AC04546]